jgi:soluble lytic murein transglycosylase
MTGAGRALLASLLAAGAAAAGVQIAPGGGPAIIEAAKIPFTDPAATLRAAREAAAAGDRSLADEGFRAAGAAAPTIADYSDLERLRLRSTAGAWEETIALAALWSHPDSPLVPEVDELVGEAHAALGQAEAARVAWRRAAEKTLDTARNAQLEWKIAASLEAEGEGEAATELYLELWTSHPLEPEAERAQQALDAITAKRGHDPRTPIHLRKRGDALFRLRRNELALEAYERALASKALPAEERGRALRQRAETLFRLRRYPEAAAALGQLPPSDERRIDRARAFARAGDVERGVRELEAIAKSARGRSAARARYLAALLVDGEGDIERAREHYREVIRSAGRTSYAQAALWRLGWVAFREGRPAEARQWFERLLRLEDDALTSLRTRYWLARTREQAGDNASLAFAALAREFPFSYYGWQARLRVAEVERSDPPPAIADGTAALGREMLARPEILLGAGMEAEARFELDRLFSRAVGLQDRLALATLYQTAGDFHQAQRLIVEAYEEPLARGPVPGQFEVWWQAWPAPFEGDMHEATAAGTLIEPGLVYALMREESGFRPSVVSTVGARGLLQIMPETGERLARDVGLPAFSAEDLFLPRVNIRLGSTYLRQLLDRFGGQKPAAIASYNAGPTAVSRWLDPTLEDDEWIEAIPYDETRAYVKRVLRSLNVYRVLY